MGRKTRDEIVTEGLELAGDTSLTARAQVWLQAQLDRIYRKQMWPFLQRQYPNIALAANTTTLAFGAGSSAADDIARVNRIVIHDGAAGGYVGEAEVLSVDEADASDLPSILKSGTGVPEKFIAEAEGTTPNRWNLSPNVPPDKTYKLIIFANRLPSALAANDKPIYPEDLTLIHGVFAWGLMQQDDERADGEHSRWERMLAKDAVVHGRVPGQKRVGLSRRVFKQR